MKLGLRVILALAFMVASIVPLSVWAVWVRSAALDREIEEVRDRHLLLARNLSLALERYAQDVSAVFSHVVETDPELRGSQHLGTLLASLSFRHICLIETGWVWFCEGCFRYAIGHLQHGKYCSTAFGSVH